MPVSHIPGPWPLGQVFGELLVDPVEISPIRVDLELRLEPPEQPPDWPPIWDWPYRLRLGYFPPSSVIRFFHFNAERVRHLLNGDSLELFFHGDPWPLSAFDQEWMRGAYEKRCIAGAILWMSRPVFASPP